MKAKDILQAKGTRVITAVQDTSLVDVMAMIFANKIGSIMVVDKYGGAVGIVSTLDILKAVHQHLGNIVDLKARDVMNTDLIVATPEDDINYIENIMTENRVRHIPIIDGAKLAGLVSIGDVVKIQMKEAHVENHYLKDYIEGKYPA
ncbi:MAG: CBS domain-containing protein [Desulfopila sp.]